MAKAGRPRGVKDSAPRQTAARKMAAAAAAQGKTPLDVMLEDMRTKYETGDLDGAATRAETCAPYVHARLASTTITHRDAIADMSYEQLVAFMERLERAAGVAERNPAYVDDALVDLPAQGHA